MKKYKIFTNFWLKLKDSFKTYWAYFGDREPEFEEICDENQKEENEELNNDEVGTVEFILFNDNTYKTRCKWNREDIESCKAFSEFIYKINRGYFEASVENVLLDFALENDESANFIDTLLQYWQVFDLIKKHNQPLIKPSRALKISNMGSVGDGD